MSGTVAPCFSASARNCAASSRISVAVERHEVRDPEAVEDREQQQRVFGRLSERFSLFDQQTCPLRSRLGFRRSIPFDMDEWGYERDLKLDLLATQRGRGGQGRDLVKGTRELLYGFDQRRALQRPLSRFAPQARGLLDQPGLGAVTRQQLRLALGDLGELAFEGFGDASVKRASRLAQQRAIGRVLHQGMLEQIGRMRRHALPEQQTSRNETVERRSQLRLRLAHHRSQQGMRELPPDRRPDLRHLLGGAEPVEPRHQRGVQACRDRQGRGRNRGDGPLALRPRSPPPAPPSSFPPRTAECRRCAR